MTLTKVEHEFFDFEEPSMIPLELNRQIRLHFSDAGPFSYCMGEPHAVIDASMSALWRGHIGREIDLTYRQTSSLELEFQVLEVRSAARCTFLYSLGCDRVFVSDQPPAEA